MKLSRVSYRVRLSLLCLPHFISYCQQNGVDLKTTIIPTHFSPTQCKNLEQYDIVIGGLDILPGFEHEVIAKGESIVVTSQYSLFDELNLTQYRAKPQIVIQEKDPDYVLQTIGRSIDRERKIITHSLLLALQMCSDIPDTVVTTAEPIYERYKDIYQLKKVKTGFEFETKLVYVNWRHNPFSIKLYALFEKWWKDIQAHYH